MIASFQDWWTRPAGAREVLALALPMVVSTSSWTIMNFIDRAFLSHYSKDAFAAAMPSSMLGFFLICFFLGVTSYVSTFVAQYQGAGHSERIGLATWQGVFIGMAVTPLIVATIPFAHSWFQITKHPPEVVELETIYYQINTFGAGAIVICSALSSFFSGRGQTSTVMYVDFSGAATNVVLDYMWIFGKFGFPEWGIAGAAWATVIALWLKVAIYLALMLRRAPRTECHVVEGFRFDRELMLRLLRFGSASGVQYFIEVGGFTAFVFLVGDLGTQALTATNMAINVNSLAFMPIYGVGIAASILVGQKLGENRPDLAGQATWSSFWISTIYTTAMLLMYLVTPELFLMGYKIPDTAEGMELHRTIIILLRFVGAYCLLDSVNMIFVSALKGAGDTFFVLVSSCVASVCTTAVLYIGMSQFGYGLYFAWTLLTIWICVLGLTYVARFMQGSWRSMRVIETEYQTATETTDKVIAAEST